MLTTKFSSILNTCIWQSPLNLTQLVSKIKQTSQLTTLPLVMQTMITCISGAHKCYLILCP